MTTIRFSQFNASLNRAAEGELITDLLTPDNAQASNVAEIIQRNNPDVLLINEFDYDTTDPLAAVRLFQENYLAVSQNGTELIEYPYVYIAPSNTGIASGFDLNNDGNIVTTPGETGYGDDALGFGNFPGQYGMLFLSKYPIDIENIRTFQNFLWKDMPGALLPDDPNTAEPNDWYSPEELAVLPLSSKSHWDIPILVNGETIHVLVSHPTPPVFDGDEDRNGKRNHDEIRFWSDYITPGQGDYIYDDNGNGGGLADGAKFVIMGDQNADPNDGDSFDAAIQQLLENPLINTSVTPDSEGSPDAAARQGGVNDQHLSDPSFDTADFGDDPATNSSGNLRADYVLPSANLEITDAQVFWPTADDPLFPLVGNYDPAVLPTGFPSSDHRLVRVDVSLEEAAEPTGDYSRNSVTGIELIGEVTLPTGTTFEETEIGGLSGLTYDEETGKYYAISDDRSQINPARFYELAIDLSDGALDEGDITFADVTTLTDTEGNPFAEGTIDLEGIALSEDGTLYISSEGDADNLIDPFVNSFTLDGQETGALSIPEKFLPTEDQSSGIRNNLAFESLTLSPDGRYLYTANEAALNQDGEIPTLEDGSPVRILRFDLTTGQADKEFLYITDAIPVAPDPADGFADNGLVELIALDNNGNFLALERSFAEGVGNDLRLYQVQLQNTTDLRDIEGVDGIEVDAVAEKTLLLNFSELGITLDNFEGMSLGEVLPDGRQSLTVVSDNNFSDAQATKFFTFALDLENTPAVAPVTETPPIIDDVDLASQLSAIAGDADDPAIWVNPNDSGESLVIASLKDGGLVSFNLDGSVNQTIASTPEYGDIRYNNVDLVYGFELGGKTVDLAVGTDRNNDTLDIWTIDPETRQLTEVTSAALNDVAAAIFGLDDGEQTAYGLATYTSPVSGETYLFVSQREGNQIAQLKLIANEDGTVSAETVRTLSAPIPPDKELADAQFEGMVVDRETGYLYAAQEQRGIWKFAAEPDGATEGTLIEAVKPEGDVLTADAEGLTIYYGADGTGYLLASSQGDSSFAVFDRQGNNEYLGNFVIDDGVDGVAESDGADVINVGLGDAFPNGLLVVHDGSNEPAVVSLDDDEEEVQNLSTNFKFIDWADVANSFDTPLDIDTESYNPREPQPDSLLGIGSGDTTQTSTVLWASSNVTGDVTFEVSTDADFQTIVSSYVATVTDTTQPVKVELAELDPNTEYFYRVTNAAGGVLTGEFQTSAASDTYAGLRFGVSGDWRGELSPYPAIANADEQNLEFFMLHGDTIYADYESPVLPGVEQATTLEEYRLKHSEVYGERLGQNTWGDLRAVTSILATIDDHEVTNDFEGGEDLAEASAEDQALFGASSGLVNDSPLYENGLQAFQGYNPIRDDFYGETGDPRTAGERKLYRYNTYGQDAAAFVLDARSFRDAELPGVTDLSDQTQVASFLAQSFDIDPVTRQPTSPRTLLGEQQLQDLKQDLLSAEEQGVTWKFVFVPEPIQNLGVLAASDRFEGYAAERTEILKFIDDNDIDNVVFVAADIHGTVTNNLTYQLAPGQEQIATNAFEVSTGSVAFDAPFGPTVAELAGGVGLLTPEQQAFYESLPVANDADSLPNDKDDFIKQLIDSGLTQLGYDPVGLNNNLSQADGLINANLLQGDYAATQTYGWTEFDIDQDTQKLTVTTYGIPYYTEAELLADPASITSLQPTIVSQFEVLPTLTTNSQMVGV